MIKNKAYIGEKVIVVGKAKYDLITNNYKNPVNEGEIVAIEKGYEGIIYTIKEDGGKLTTVTEDKFIIKRSCIVNLSNGEMGATGK